MADCENKEGMGADLWGREGRWGAMVLGDKYLLLKGFLYLTRVRPLGGHPGD